MPDDTCRSTGATRRRSMAIVRPCRPNLSELCVYRPFLDHFDVTFYYSGLAPADCRVQLDSLGLSQIRAVRYATYADTVRLECCQRAIDFKVGLGSLMLTRLRDVMRHGVINVVDPIYAFTGQVAGALREGQKLVVIRWENMHGRYDRIWLARRRARKVLRRAHLIVCSTWSSFYSLQTPEGSVARLEQVYPGIDVQRFSVEPEAAGRGSRSAGSGTGTPAILFVGRLQWTKGLHSLLAAMRILRLHLDLRPQAWVVGGGRQKPYADMTAAMGIQDQVRFFGRLSIADVFQKMKEAAVFCSPSLPSPNWTEQYGFAMVEAMAHGLPVVAFDSGAIREVCGEDGIYASSGNEYSLAESLARVLSRREEAAERGARLRQRALTEFDAERQGRKLLNLIA